MASSSWGNSPDSNDGGWGGNSGGWGNSTGGSGSGWGSGSGGNASGWGDSTGGSGSGWGGGSGGNASGWGNSSGGSGSSWGGGSGGNASGWGDSTGGNGSGWENNSYGSGSIGSADYGSRNQPEKRSPNQSNKPQTYDHTGFRTNDHPYTADHVQTSLKVARNEYRGVVNTINSTMAHRKPAFLQRWLESLFYGKPFSMQPTSITILLSMDSYQKAQKKNIGTGLSVHAYTDSDNGIVYVSQGNRITVHGKRGFDGVIHANTIYNETTGTQMRCGFPAWGVRIITALLLIVIYNVAALLLGNTGALFGSLDMAVLQDRLVEGIAILVILGLFWSVLRHNPRLRSHVAWICLILLAMLFVPSIGYILVLLYGMRFLIGRF